MEPAKTEAQDWIEANSDTFIEFAPYFVPWRKSQFDTLVSLLPSREGLRIAELAAGAGDLAARLLERSDITITVFERSERMLSELTSRFAGPESRVTVRKFDLSDTSWRDELSEFDCVISSLAIHHLKHSQKRQLFCDLAKGMKTCGRFVLADIIEPATEVSKRSYAHEWDAAVLASSLTAFGDDRAFQEFRKLAWNHYSDPDPDPIDLPAGLLEQLAWLTDAGFKNVDIHWLYAGHAIMSGDT